MVLPMLLALLLAPVGAVAAPDEAPGATAEAAAPAAPVLVQSHQAFVRITGGRATVSTTWSIVVLDPARAEGLRAPAGLDGAEARGASVRYSELRLPPGLAAGTTLTFTATAATVLEPFSPSGVFRTVLGLPVARAEVVVRAVGAPLGVWCDPTGRPEWASDKRDEVRIVWRDVEPDAMAEAVWSGGRSWIDEGRELVAQVEGRLPARLGRDLTQDLAGMTPTTAAQTVFRAIRLIPGPDVGWTGRAGDRALAEGAGTRAERGLVLIALLRAAGYAPIPALYRPSSLPGSVPPGLTAPSLLPRPVIAVPMGDQVLWIDPGADWVQLPSLPTELTGATVWVPGDLPRALSTAGAPDGTLSISGEIRLDRDGPATFAVVITSVGAADELLRDRLGSLDDAGRAAWFRDLLAEAWPGIERVTVAASGMGSRDLPVSLTVRGQLPRPTRAVVDGVFTTSVRALLAPALAAAAPPRLFIREELSIASPPGLTLLTATEAPRVTHPAAVVHQIARADGDRVLLTTDVERPRRHLPPSEDARARQVLARAAASGPELLHLAEATPAVARRARASGLAPEERVALEAAILWRAARYPAARKLLRRFLEPVGLGALDTALRRIQAPYELRRELVDLPVTEADRLATVPLLVAMGRTDEAWARAAEVASTQVHALRVDARLHLVALQPPQRPDPAVDPEAAARWRDPMELLGEAEASAQRAPGGGPDPRVLTAKARLLLAQGEVDASLALLRQAAARSDDPGVAILLAEVSARAGVPLDRVEASLQAAIDAASDDPSVYARVSDTLASLGARDEALAHALTAARLAGRDAAAWRRAAERALAAGELATALHAAERASSLALTDVEAANLLTRTATLAGRTDLATVGWGRGGTALATSDAPTAAELVGLVAEDELLGVLRYHDDEVIGDPSLLSLRAELELAAGRRARAARDGTLLWERHRIARGALVAFAATVGVVWTSDGAEDLDEVAQLDPAARAARIEHRALLGARIDGDLRRGDTDPRARVWRAAVAGADALAAEDPAFTPGLPPSDVAPRGFVRNRVLGAGRGVAAWSSALAEQAVLRQTGDRELPPPLSALYTVETPALAALPDGGKLVRLTGGALPLYAAIRTVGHERILGLGHSPEAAARALAAVPAP
jgi:tetratricopeptide (TPR) repeat protein